MTDQSHQPDGDGLLRGLIFKVLSEEIMQPRPEYLPAHFNNAVTRLLALVNEQTHTQPTRDGAEVAGDVDALAEIWRICNRADEYSKQKLAAAIAVIVEARTKARAAAPPKPAPESWPHDAPPLEHLELLGPDGMGTPSRAQIEAAFGVDRPAPDAMREYVARLIEIGDWLVAKENPHDASALYSIARALSAPVPPADGARLALEHAEVRFRCLSDHFKEVGEEALWAMSEVDAERMRKGLASLPSGAGAAEPDWARTAVEAREAAQRATDNSYVNPALKQIPMTTGLVTSPVRGDRDREAMREACDLLAERKYGNPARSPGHNARLRLESALSLPLQSTARPDREAFYTILKKYYAEDATLDAAYQELKEAAGVQPGAGVREALRNLVDWVKSVEQPLAECHFTEAISCPREQITKAEAALSRQAPPSSSEGGR